MTARKLDTQTIFSETQAYSIHRIETREHGLVIVKESRSHNPSRKEISQLENEFRMLKSVEGTPGVPKALALEVESHKAILVLEDFGGVSLKDFAAGKPLSLKTFFAISQKIVATLGKLHSQNIVHCDLKPNNIIINPETLAIQIIDFGSSRHLVGRGQFQNDGQSLTLAYIAPEQTGRVNRRVDHRTDTYSLGITFYELLAGKLPFQANDTLEWVHAHIAKKARTLHELDHHVTPALSQIVDRMMSKAPEERYQTSEGLLYDLQVAEQLFEEKLLWDSMRLGERDRSTYLLPSQKIVGREQELSFLQVQYEKAEREGLQVVSIQGEAGVGKSALVREFRRLYAERATLFGFGKADPRQKNFPFGALTSISDDLVRQIAAAPDHLKTVFTSELSQRLQSAVGALFVVAPELKELFAHVDRVDTATDTEGRLFNAILAFFQTMSDVFGQVVILLDDAHFIDESSARFFTWLKEHGSELHALVLFNYRQSEIGDTLLSVLQTNKELQLRDLKLEDVTYLLQDTLQDQNPRTHELGALLLKKSGGNALFVSQVMKSWIDEQFLFHDPYQGWTWDRKAIEEKEIAKSVLDLLGSKVNSLPKNIRYIFTMASCFPSTFTTTDLSELTGIDHAGIRRAADATVQAGLTISDTENVFRFSHEQIREAFYSMLNQDARRDLHAHVGLKLLRTLDLESVSNDQVYTTSQHLNVGLSKVKDPEARQLIAQLNLRASRLARDSSAFPLALTFADFGIEACRELSFNEKGSVLYDLYSLKGECEYLSGDFESAKETFKLVQQHAQDRTEQIRASLQWFKILQATGRTSEALEFGMKAITATGIQISHRLNRIALTFDLVRAAWSMRGNKLREAKVLEIKTADDEFRRLRHDLLVLTGQAAYFTNKPLFLKIATTGVRLGLREGLTAEICNHVLMVTLLYATRLGWHRKVEENCVNSIDRIGLRASLHAQLLSAMPRWSFIKPWITPWSEVVENLERNEDIAIKGGEPFSASIAAMYGAYIGLYQGHSLEETDVSRGRLKFLERNNALLRDCTVPSYAFRAQLRGDTASDTDMSFESFSESEYLERIAKSPSPNPRAWYDAHKMMSLFMFGHYDEAASYFAGARRYITLAPFSITIILIRLFGVMNVCENMRAGKKPSLYLRYRVWISRRFIQHCARMNPIDVEPYAHLVEAELAVIRGRQLEAMNYYERAAEAALKTKSWMCAGLIYERTARFNTYNGRERLARAHAQEAAYCFERWGAAAKVRQIRKLYGLHSTRVTDSSSSSSSTDSTRLSERVDAETIIKSTRALSSELDLGALSVKLVNVVTEFAGATRAVLVINGQVKASTDSDMSYPALVSDASRSRTSMTVEQSLRDERTKNDVYFSARAPMSAMCLPIVQNNELLAVLYLENDSGSAVFSADRQDLLELLLSQAGVAIENARLYSEVVEKVRMSGELKTAQAVQKTLFPNAQLKRQDVAITGYYEPASECGGDWWFYHEHGDKLFVYIGDATGHGASAALVTSAVRSAVSLLSEERDLTPQLAMKRLNRAIFETSKGTMNMTFFIGAYDRKTGTFDYCNASHEPSFLVRRDLLERLRMSAGTFNEFKKEIGMLADLHGARLGEDASSEYSQSSVQMNEGDVVVLYTDGVQDARNDRTEEWGQRRFLRSIFQATMKSSDVDEIVQQVVSDNKVYTGSTPHDDDVMIVALKGR